MQPWHCSGLPAIVKRLKGAVPILVDGGVQTGLDVYKMMLLGADAVMIGRAFTRAVMSDLEQGAAQYIRQLKADFSHAMLMTGCRTVAEIYKGRNRRFIGQLTELPAKWRETETRIWKMG